MSDKMTQVQRTRVNGMYMQQNHGKQVCLLGIIVKSDGGQAFTVKASDGAMINVRMRQPLTEPLSGLIEVCGVGQGKNLILGDSYVTFPEGIQNTFSMKNYNQLVVLINTIEEGKGNPWKAA